MLPPELKLLNAKVADHLSEETIAFTADIEVDGQTVGSVRNDGRGGSHTYRFNDPEARAAFERVAAAWAQHEGVTLEPDDQLVSELLEHTDILDQARALAKKTGAHRLMLIRKQPIVIGSQPGHPIGWGDTYLITLGEQDDPDGVAARQGADSHFVINADGTPPAA